MPRSTRSTGLLLALACALIGAGVVLFVFISHKPKPAGAQNAPGSLDAEPLDITQVAATGPGGAKQAIIEMADKNDPTRRVGQFIFDKLDPRGQGAYEATGPKAWLYMKDGRSIYIRADTGRVRIPGGGSGTPESGEFTGNGLLLMFPKRPIGADPIDPDHDAPGLVARFTSINFDTVLLEMSTQQDVFINAPGVSATLHGLLVRFDEVGNRIEFAKVPSGGQVRTHVRSTKPEAPATTSAPTPAIAAPVAAIAHTIDTTFVGPPEPPPTPLATVEFTKEDRYRAVFTKDVTVTQVTRQLTSDTLTVWARLEDNKLPPNAFGPDDNEHKSDKPHAHAASHASAPTRSLIPSLISTLLTAAGPASLFTPEEDDVELTWTGAMTLNPIAPTVTVPELNDRNHIHARFSADGLGGRPRVGLTDSQSGTVGACGVLDYAASLGTLTLRASDPDKQPTDTRADGFDRVDMYVPGVGRFAGDNFAINLFSGVGQVRGRGSLTSLKTDQITVVPAADLADPVPDDLVQQIRWGDQADFEFLTKNNRISTEGGGLKSARFGGTVLARDRWSFISGDSLATDFVQSIIVQPPTPKPVTNRTVSVISRLRADGQVLAVLAPGKVPPDRALPPLDPYLLADSLDVRFQPPPPGSDDPREAQPTRLLARGSVTATDTKSAISCQKLDASLLKNARNRVDFGDVRAEQDVLVQRNDGVFARADLLVANGQTRSADLTGNAVALGLGNATINATQAHLEEARGLLQVFGRGNMDLIDVPEGLAFDLASFDPANVDPAKLPPGVSIVRAVWERSMSFVDATGRLECHGNTQITQTSADGGRVARANRLFVDLTPRGQSSESSSTSAPAPPSGAFSLADFGADALGERKLLKAEAVGAILDDPTGAPASVKAWKYAAADASAPATSPTPASRQFDQVLYLEGPRIIADQVATTVSVPDAGRGIIFDKGSSTPAPASPTLSAGSSQAASPFAANSSGAAGDTMFTWGGSMLFNQATGALALERTVELRHRPLDATAAGTGIRMTCAKLDAKFDTANSSSRGTQLLTADATGGVYAESGVQNLTSDTLTYDAPNQLATALALGDSPVTFTDTTNASPLLARSLGWDLKKNLPNVKDPWPVIAPLPK